jgi:hypothetical protein
MVSVKLARFDGVERKARQRVLRLGTQVGQNTTVALRPRIIKAHIEQFAIARHEDLILAIRFSFASNKKEVVLSLIVATNITGYPGALPGLSRCRSILRRWHLNWITPLVKIGSASPPAMASACARIA